MFVLFLFRRLYPGFLVAAGTSALMQDCMGKEGYIRHVESHWIDPAQSTPIAVIAVLIGVVLAMIPEKKEKENT